LLKSCRRSWGKRVIGNLSAVCRKQVDISETTRSAIITNRHTTLSEKRGRLESAIQRTHLSRPPGVREDFSKATQRPQWCRGRTLFCPLAVLDRFFNASQPDSCPASCPVIGHTASQLVLLLILG